MRHIKYLDKEHIYIIHQYALSEFGGVSGYYDYTDGKIDSILAQQYPVFDYDKYPSIFHKSAMLIYFFTKGHCFIDGNKRVGIQSAIVFLEVNGYEDYLDDDEGYEKTIEITALDLSGPELDEYINKLARWLSKRFKKPKIKLRYK